jgi:ornithine carbamoyltransferase
MVEPIHFLTVNDFNKEDLTKILNLAEDVKKEPQKYSNTLKGKTMAMLFQKTSTRTRLSFEIGMQQLGGYAAYVDWRTTNLVLGSLADEMACIGRYVDMIMARVYKHEDLIVMAKAAKKPVINGLSDLFHPCQILADYQTIFERLGKTSNFQITFIGDGNNNVTHSLMMMSLKMGNRFNLACPKEYMPNPLVMNIVNNSENKDLIQISNDPKEMMRDADIIYSDTFVSMGKEEESLKRLEIFKDFQLNAEKISWTGKNPYILHCLPAHREIEITSEILDSERSIVFDQAENRLHAQKALMILIMQEKIKMQKRY